MIQGNAPSHWKLLPIESAATLQRGRDLPIERRTNGPYPVIGSNGMVGYHSKYAARGPGVCVGRSGSVGKVTWVDGDYWPLNTVLWVTDFYENVPEFIYYLLDYLDLGQYAAGVSVPTLNRNVVHPVKILLPPLPEQRAIALVLRAVQSAREARQREVALERERKAALMEHLFTHGTRGEPTKQTPIGEMPESWELRRLGDLATVRGGKRLPKGAAFATGSTPYPYIRVVDMVDGTVRTDDLRYLTIETCRAISQYIIRDKDVYISIAGSIGLVGTIPPALDGANLTENAARLVISDPSRLSRDFLALYLDGQSGQGQISNLTAKTTQPKLALARIEQIRLPMPTLAEQQRIADVLQACKAKIVALERESALLDELFRALLKELMTGRVSAAEVPTADSGDCTLQAVSRAQAVSSS